MSYYECKRCGHITKQKIEIIRHLNRKKKCLRIINSYNYNENEIEKASLIKHSYKQNHNNTKFMDLINIDSHNHTEDNQLILQQSNLENNNNNIIQNTTEFNLDTDINNDNVIDNNNDTISDAISDNTSDYNDENNIIIDNEFKNKLNKNIKKKEETNYTCDICLKYLLVNTILLGIKKNVHPTKLTQII